MNESILYAIWLKENCDFGSMRNMYVFDNHFYYIDSKTDMEILYSIFKESDYYKNSI